MFRFIILAAVLMCVSLPASAEVLCKQPYAPEIQSGVGMTEAEMLSMRDDTQAFMEASDKYQACLLKSASGRTLIKKNQAEKVRIARTFNKAVAAFNNNNPFQAASLKQ